jgi:two-component system, cell cycle sensor histidine kinase and response regulator CckA
VAPAAPSAQPAPLPSESASETILLVEDDGPVRSLAARVLRNNGYTVVEAENGSQALAVADERRGEIDLALSDIVMPGLGGHDLAAELRARHPGVRVLFMSGYDDTPSAGAAPAVEEIPQLSKPFTQKDLLHAVRSTLAQRGRVGQTGAAPACQDAHRRA